jgi:hypothetical protein
MSFACEAAELFMVAPELSAPDPLKLIPFLLREQKTRREKRAGD